MLFQRLLAGSDKRHPPWVLIRVHLMPKHNVKVTANWKVATDPNAHQPSVAPQASPTSTAMTTTPKPYNGLSTATSPQAPAQPPSLQKTAAPAHKSSPSSIVQNKHHTSKNTPHCQPVRCVSLMCTLYEYMPAPPPSPPEVSNMFDTLFFIHCSWRGGGV